MNPDNFPDNFLTEGGGDEIIWGVHKGRRPSAGGGPPRNQRRN
jgi:hypothetical protein